MRGGPGARWRLARLGELAGGLINGAAGPVFTRPVMLLDWVTSVGLTVRLMSAEGASELPPETDGMVPINGSSEPLAPAA